MSDETNPQGGIAAETGLEAASRETAGSPIGENAGTQESDSANDIIKKLREENTSRRHENKKLTEQTDALINQLARVRELISAQDSAASGGAQQTKPATPQPATPQPDTAAQAKIQALLLRNSIIARGDVNPRAAKILADAVLARGVTVDIDAETVTGLDDAIEAVKTDYDFCFVKKSIEPEKPKTEPLGRNVAAGFGQKKTAEAYPQAMIDAMGSAGFTSDKADWYYEKVWCKVHPELQKKGT